MLDIAANKPTAPVARTTAEDTLKQKSRDANVISGGHLVAKALKAEGVDTIFTLCGGHITDIYDGCIDEGIRVIDVRHEQVAAHAADGYAARPVSSVASSPPPDLAAPMRSPALRRRFAPKARCCASDLKPPP